MGSNNPPFWSAPSFMDFNSYDGRSLPTDYRQQPAQPTYSHPDWSGPPDQDDQRIPGSTFDPTFQSSRAYLSQSNSYGASPGNLAQVQQQPLRPPFSGSNHANINTNSSGLPGEPFTQSNEEYRGRGRNFPPQQHTTFGNQTLAQLPPPPALYHPPQMLDHPGGQAYRHQVIPLSDVGSESGTLDLFSGSPAHSRVPSQDGSFHSHDSPNQQPLHLHVPSPLQSRSNVGNMHDGTGYLKAGPSIPATSRLKRARSQEESFAYDHNPSGDDYDQPKEDINRVKSGACARCKTLKVKCEFRDESETCRRCANGGHECVIPGRKKRRIPPKREHLLNEIRTQAAEIQRLMTQLQLANQQASAAATLKLESPSRDQSNSGYPTRSPSQIGFASPSPDTPAVDEGAVVPKPEVLDWVAKAKESIEAFGGYIGIGTASVARDLIRNSDDSMDSDSDDDKAFLSARGSEEEVEAASVTSEDHEVGPMHASPESRGRRRDMTPSSEKPATIPSHVAPFGLMANLLRKTRLSSDQGEEDAEKADEVGVARKDYFRASTPDPTTRIADVDCDLNPDILRGGIVTPAEVDKLFKIYYDYMNPSCSIMDPVLYTAGSTYYRSPLLFTVICAIASRHLPDNPKLYRPAMCSARRIAASSLISGQKSIEMVIAYILLAIYPVPMKRYEEDRSWIFLGMAIRMAFDLNLHIRSTVKPKNSLHARELLNRTRVWLNCYNVDRSIGSQYGRAPTIPNHDWIASHSEDWWKSSDQNIKGFDIHISAYTSELREVSKFRAQIYSDPESPTGMNKNTDFETLACKTDDNLVMLRERWQPIFAVNNDPNDLHAKFRTSLISLAISYARLVALSIGMKRHSGSTEDPFIIRCWHAACDVCFVVVNELNSLDLRILVRHGPDAQSVFATFAATFLIKLLHPKYIPVFTQQQRQESYNLIQRVIDTLGSPEVAIDDKHGPKLYSRLLKGLLATVRLDAPYPGRRTPSRTRKPPSKNSSSFGSGPTSPTRSSLRPVTPEMYPPISQIQAEDAHSPTGDGSSGGSPTSMQGLNVQEFFAPPLPFDGELLHSMQNLTTSTEWEGMAMPGWNWMGGLQPSGEMSQGALPPGTFPPLPTVDLFSPEFSAPNFQRF